MAAVRGRALALVGGERRVLLGEGRRGEGRMLLGEERRGGETAGEARGGGMRSEKGGGRRNGKRRNWLRVKMKTRSRL